MSIRTRQSRARGARPSWVAAAACWLLACAPASSSQRASSSLASGPASAGSQTPALPAAPRARAQAQLQGSTAPVGARRLARRTPLEGRAVAEGERAAVSSAEPHATAVGLSVLRGGGNAVDAAVAVAFALGVTHPSAGNIGGGGFLLLRASDGRATAIDYREAAPARAHPDMYLDESGRATTGSQYGPLAAGIPGVVAGLWLAHARYGSRPWAELVTPAVALARQGHALDRFHALELALAREEVLEYQAELDARPPARDEGRSFERAALRRALDATLAAFTRPDGSALREGDVWRQPELATTLDVIAREGARAFYQGPLAARMASSVSAMGGIWSAADLASYSAIERRPLSFEYRGHELLTMPPPSAGGVVLRQILAASELLSLHSLDWGSDERMHLFAEILRRVYADRNEWLGDPDFVDLPLAELLAPAYAARRVAGIDRQRATPSRLIRAGLPHAEPLHTTHFSVVDASGMAVANTFTLNTGFGALVQIPGTGVTLNNEMDDFTTKRGEPNLFGLVQGLQNTIAPGKRMLSSMSPTIVVRGGRLRAVLGSPGGPTITTTVAQLVMQLVDHRRSLVDAVRAPRLHHQWLPDELLHEPGLPAQAVSALARRGHTLTRVDHIGHANCVELDAGVVRAVADIERAGGGAAAY